VTAATVAFDFARRVTQRFFYRNGFCSKVLGYAANKITLIYGICLRR
jgi:hypothetical protein